jgi:hypothetical protein
MTALRTPGGLAELLDEPVVADLVEQLSVLRLAYNAPDGSPRVVPVNYALAGDRFRVWTASTAPKVAALRADPRVALTLDAADPPHALLVRGTAAVELVDGVPDDYVEVMRTRADALPFERWLTDMRHLHPTMARIEVTPTWASIVDFETRFPQAIDEVLRSAST